MVEPVCPRRREVLRRLEAAERRIAELEAPLGQNSSNSALPPSANSPAAPKPVVKKPTGRPSGAQPGHKPDLRQRLPAERLTQVMRLLPWQCRACRADLPAPLALARARPHRYTPTAPHSRRSPGQEGPSMHTARRIVLLLCTAVVAAARAEEPEVRPGVVFVVGGVGGVDPLQACAPFSLPLAGVPHEFRVFEWTHGKFHMLRDLQDTRYLQDRATELADQVLAVKAQDSSRPVYLMGHSAGAAVVLEAAVHLPPATLERIILLSAAVSPTYDLRPALRATRGEVVAFSSSLDRFMLFWGTTHFGTAVDRLYVPAAGMDGFQVPDKLDEEGRKLYGRLVQSGWTPDMLLERRCLHNSTCMPLFLARQVTPWLTRP